MKHLLILFLLTLGIPALTAAQGAPATAPREEMRAVFVSRFEWPGGSAETVRTRLTNIFSTLRAGNLNTVILQVRGQGDTFYPSKDEPWSESASADLRTSDPIAFALAEARRNNLQLYAWINLSTIWQGSPEKLPRDRSHPFYRFADASTPATATGLIHDAQGKPKQFGADGYVWLTSGNPEVNAYLRRQVDAFLATYEVDGMVWDDRTGLPNGASRDPISVRRHAGRGNPMKVQDFHDWQLDQLTRFLSDMYVTIKARHPRIVVVGAPFGIADKRRIPGYGRFSDARSFGVEPEKWLNLGLVDGLMPQVYWDEPDPAPNYSVVVRDWVANNKSGRPIWPASALGKYGSTPKQTIDPWQASYVRIARELNCGGNAFYNWSGATPDDWKSAARVMYPTPAAVPVPAHMRRPTGQIMGTVRTATGAPIVDCWIKTNKSSYIHLSSGDGFFGIPNLEPGVYTLFWSAVEGQSQSRSINVAADATTRVDLTVP